jgi:hypothetical protein
MELVACRLGQRTRRSHGEDTVWHKRNRKKLGKIGKRNFEVPSYTVHYRATQTGVYIFFDVSGFKAIFGVKWLTDIDKQPVENSDIQVKNARLSGPNASKERSQTGKF